MTALVMGTVCSAAEKVVVTFDTGGEVSLLSIQVGNIEYVADAKTPDVLKTVRVWKKPDSLLYDLAPHGVSYECAYDNTPKAGKEMSAVEAAQKWANFVKKFAKLREGLEIRVIK